MPIIANLPTPNMSAHAYRNISVNESVLFNAESQHNHFYAGDNAIFQFVLCDRDSLEFLMGKAHDAIKNGMRRIIRFLA